ncbi:COQ9 family protein [Sphingomicrobium flavum]|uniref:COQ9 family protein n=1 Tax=Sphingomicrobium flavum TaxID=1229164 RepID=UPI0021ADA14A|nr:COQ9 family protein [Sphingomicrobium flavum]
MATPLELIRLKLALAVGENAVFDGWTEKAVLSAASQQGVDPDQARLAFPDDPAQMVAAWIEGVDAAMVAAFPTEKLAAMGITARIRAMIWHRLEIVAPAKEAVRSALSILAMPQNAITGLKTGWNSADLMWRLAGDTSTDYNHYTKRIILSGVYGSTLLAWLDDDSEDMAETAAFLDRRLADVGKFEKAKAQWRRGQEMRPSLTRFLGRLRYPAR